MNAAFVANPQYLMHAMHAHHQESIRLAVAHFTNDPEAHALILGGSVAYGFATPASDIDVMIIVSDRDYEERLRDDPRAETILSFYEAVTQFRRWECNVPWPAQFMRDSELNWLDGRTPVDDV